MRELYRCRPRVEVQTDFGPSTGTCGAWLHQAYIAKGNAKFAVAIGWFCEQCETFIRGDDPLAEVDLEGYWTCADEYVIEDFLKGRGHR